MYRDQDELLVCCRILFGDACTLSSDFLDYIQEGGLRNAYRQRAKSLHPDLASSCFCRDDAENGRLFFEMQQAYARLLQFVDSREHSFSKSREKRKRNVSDSGHPKTAGNRKRWESRERRERQEDADRPFPRSSCVRKKREGDKEYVYDEKQCSWQAADIHPFILPSSGNHKKIANFRSEKLYQGPMPQRSLLFGNFLYYSGLTNWRTISRVLIWQHLERPHLGEVGLMVGMLTLSAREHVLRIQRSRCLPFGEIAVRVGVLDRAQVQILLARQQILQKKFGALLVEKNLVSTDALSLLLSSFHRHNRCVLRGSGRYG